MRTIYHPQTFRIDDKKYMSKRALRIFLNNIVLIVRILLFSSMFVRLISICNIDAMLALACVSMIDIGH